MNKTRMIAICVIALLALAGCMPVSQGATPTEGGEPDLEIPPAAILTAQAWLADQLGVAAEEVDIQSMEQVEWRDGCLELGGPDEGCLTVITPGWLIFFEVGGVTYEVHTDDDAVTIRLAGGEATNPAGPTQLTSTRWVLVSFGLPGEESPELPVLTGTTVSLEFQAGSQAGGSGGCNSYGATYQVDGDRITFSQITTTEMACLEGGVMEQEQKYYQALESAERFEVTENQLRIWYDGGSATLNFAGMEDVPPAPTDVYAGLTGTSWILSTFGREGEETEPAAESGITIEFLADGQAGGSGGCNQYGTSFMLENGAMLFGEITSTLIACSDEVVVQQEQAYFEALRSAGAYELAGDRLTILYDDGAARLNFVRDERPEEPTDLLLIRSIKMPDSQNGWAVGQTGLEAPFRILSTADGGASWIDRTPSDVTVSDTGPIQIPPAAHFASPRSAWVAFPGQPGQGAFNVWHTDDGGETWTGSEALDLEGIPLDGFIPSDLGFLDGQFGWLLAHLGAGMSHDYFAIFTTGDGGQTWQRVADPNATADLQGCAKSGLVFTSPLDGWFSGDCPALMPQLFFYRTTDGGVTWSAVDLPVPDNLEVADGALGDRCGISQLGAAQPDTVFFLLRCPDFENATTQTWVANSTDLGSTWSYAPLPSPNAAFVFLTPQQGWILGSEQNDPEAAGTIYRTTDGGLTWETLAEDVQGFQLEFSDPEHAWIVPLSGRPILYSEDGGATWVEIEPQLSG